jgi:hypothetical protein
VYAENGNVNVVCTIFCILLACDIFVQIAKPNLYFVVCFGHFKADLTRLLWGTATFLAAPPPGAEHKCARPRINQKIQRVVSNLDITITKLWVKLLKIHRILNEIAQIVLSFSANYRLFCNFKISLTRLNALEHGRR